MIQIFGDFREEPQDNVDYLIVGFSPASLPLKQRWRNKGLSADFIAEYLQTFFVGKEQNTSNGFISAYNKNAAKYIANELLENAMKFSDPDACYSTRISFYLHNDQLAFYISNSLNAENKEKFQVYLEKILTGDPQQLYIEQMEANAQEANGTTSRLGFLSMICDYSAILGWRFTPLPGDAALSVVTTMVALDL